MHGLDWFIGHALEHANQAVLAQLKALVQLNERLKRQESQFKARYMFVWGPQACAPC